MYSDLIREQKTIHLSSEGNLTTLLAALIEETVWSSADMEDMHIAYHNPGDMLPSGEFAHSRDDVIRAFKEQGGYYLVINRGFGNVNIPICIKTCPFTMDDRAGIRSKLLSDYLAGGSTEDYAALINRGFSYYTGKVKILIRGGYVLAIHSDKYNDFSQDLLFGLVNIHMKSYEDAHFIDGDYDLERTIVNYAVCESGDKFFESYEDAWKKAGMPENILRQCYPVLSFATGDTGRYPVTITPKLYLGSSVLPLGSQVSIKHTSKLTSENFEQKARLCFANMKDGLESIEGMIKTTLLHPYAVFVKVATRAGITGRAKVAITKCLENFKDMYDKDVDRISAFDVYYSICEMVHLEEFKALSESTKLMVEESFNRLLQIDYAKLDYAGREEF